MRLLLDTHVFLWAASGSPRLKAPTRRLIEAAEKVFVSSASIWEIAIKASLGKIDADPAQLLAAIPASGFTELPVRGDHAAGVASLANHHQDPFDRLLLAQAIAEPLRLMTADRYLAKYSELVLQI